MAKSYLTGPQFATKPELKELIEKFPATDAAKEAKELLDKW